MSNGISHIFLLLFFFSCFLHFGLRITISVSPSLPFAQSLCVSLMSYIHFLYLSVSVQIYGAVALMFKSLVNVKDKFIWICRVKCVCMREQESVLTWVTFSIFIFYFRFYSILFWIFFLFVCYLSLFAHIVIVSISSGISNSQILNIATLYNMLMHILIVIVSFPFFSVRRLLYATQ